MKRNRLIPILIVLFAMLGVLGSLGWLRMKFQQQEERFLESVVRPFELSEVLLRPEENSVDFEQVEFLAKSLAERDIVQEVVVTKTTPSGELTIFPFYQSVLEPEWLNSQPWEVREIVVDQEVVGKIYLQLDRSTRNAIDRTLIISSCIFSLSLLVLLAGYLEKDVRLESTKQELVNRQKEVIRLERLALVGQLSANIFHDIKKPVQNIKHAAADALASGNFTLEDAREISAHAELFQDILRELGIEKFSQGNHEEAEFCDLVELMNRSIALVRYEQGAAKISLDVQAELPLVLCSSTHLIQVFSNLLLNAYQAMNQPGEVRVVFSRNEGEAVVQISDSGPGIPVDFAARIFLPFETTKDATGGTGLGLFIVDQILKQWGGSISLESPNPTRFKLVFPKALWEAS